MRGEGREGKMSQRSEHGRKELLIITASDNPLQEWIKAFRILEAGKKFAF